MRLPVPAAVIFDCDGVLVDSEILALEVEQKILAGLGLAYDLPTFRRRFLGMHDTAFRDALDADRRALHGVGLPPSFLDDTHTQRRAAVEARLVEVTGARAAVETLAAPRAVASSTGAAFLEVKLRKTKLWDLFAPHAYSADLVAHGKPAPDIFLLAASRMGIEPKRCLVLEDSSAGVTGAKAAGMKTVGFLGGSHIRSNHRARLEAAGADIIAESYGDVAKLLRIG